MQCVSLGLRWGLVTGRAGCEASEGGSAETNLPREGRAGLAHDVAGVGDRIIAQFSEAQDVSNDEMIRSIKDALAGDAGFPLPLIVLDEVQVFIGNSGDRAYAIQEVVESCSKHFGGRLLFVDTGQTAVSGTPSLEKIMGGQNRHGRGRGLGVRTASARAPHRDRRGQS
jgi:hypothetical protein